MADDKGKVEVPSIGVSLNLQYAAGRTVVFQTHVPQSISVEGLDVILDKFNAVGDRAEAYYAQEQARRQLEVETKSLNNLIRRLAEVDDNMRLKAAQDNRRNYKPSPQDEVQKKQALDNLEESKRRVAECTAFLEELVKKAGNRDGASSPADR
jgi:hypothetical protein